ncbi:hypothetical protein FRIGORI9N_280017 [Frigoribacterium sp. 9N]|nr:hypothetical protein FRIGORI9N_280017 [Frigoribacterium sp. 9N]
MLDMSHCYGWDVDGLEADFAGVLGDIDFLAK